LLCAVLMAFAVSAAAQAPSSASCATCHHAVAATYASAPMRHAIEPTGASTVLNTHPNLSVQLHGYSYIVQTKDGQSTYTVSDGKHSIALPVRWSFGEHAQTWVIEKDGQMYESLVSYYPRAKELATTPGDEQITPHDLTKAMGRQLPTGEIHACFSCHASNVTFGEAMVPTKLSPGIDCERCHSGSLTHMVDAEHDNFKTIPASLKHLNAEQVSDLCGQCHRTFDGAMRNHWRGSAFVRFQPYRLALSKCFIGSDPRISCLACHDPHQPANRNIAFYDAKCLACHARGKPASAGITPKLCPIAKQNCTTCHMPRVELAGGHAQFTDHFIRIVATGESYPY
jgi:hypothetical protein